MISFIQVRTWVVGLWVAVSSQATRGSYNCLMEKYQTTPRFSEAQGPKQLFIDRNSLDGNTTLSAFLHLMMEHIILC